MNTMLADWMMHVGTSDILAFVALLVGGFTARTARRQARMAASQLDLATQRASMERLIAAHKAQVDALEEQQALLVEEVARAKRHTEECEAALELVRAELRRLRQERNTLS